MLKEADFQITGVDSNSEKAWFSFGLSQKEPDPSSKVERYRKLPSNDKC